MAVARVVTFDGVTKDRMDEMNREMSEGAPPEGFPPAELIVLHDAGREFYEHFRRTRGKFHEYGHDEWASAL